MSRRKRGIVYLIHFERRHYRALHYMGWTSLTLSERLQRHLTDRGAKLLRAINQLGIGYQVVRQWENVPQSFEITLKRRKNHKSLCPVCMGELTYEQVTQLHSHPNGGQRAS